MRAKVTKAPSPSFTQKKVAPAVNLSGVKEEDTHTHTDQMEWRQFYQTDEESKGLQANQPKSHLRTSDMCSSKRKAKKQASA